MPPPLEFAARTDIGVKRTHNQDAYAAQPAPDDATYRSTGHIFVVADGMGGHAVGEMASEKAVREIPLTFTKHVAGDGPAAAVRRALSEANAAIYGIGQNKPEFKGLGTTGTALFLRPEGAWVGHVGDSRAYRIRAGRLQQLTFDHSWVWEVAKRQGVDPDDLGDFKKNVIIRSLGPDPEVEVDVEGPHPVEPGDAFLLCSDGLCNQLHPDELGAITTAFPPDEACHLLVELANLRGGPDNITCVIARVPGGPRDKSVATLVRPSAVLRAAGRWNKAVPWPLSALGAGVLVAGLSIALRAAEVPGAVVFFLLAALLILGGLAGLGLMVRRGDRDAGGSDSATELHLYRDHPAEVTAQLVERFTGMEGQLREVLVGKNLPVDWAAHGRHMKEADAATAKGALGAAFAARCRALQVLAEPFNKVRHKEESFQPNWATKAVGG